MKITTIVKQFLFLSFTLLQCAAHAAPAPVGISHMGPTIRVIVQRGTERLPIYWVNHLQKNDKVLVSTDQAKKSRNQWLLTLATLSPTGNLAQTRSLDLSEDAREVSIDITADDQIPVIVLAPEVRTMFGLHTSFSESASLIEDAIKTDPQRFIELQKIDQINHVINYLLRVLDTLLQSKKPEQAIEAAKDLAGKFGVKYIDPDCFKGNAVNTKCVAASIVSSADLAIPTEDVWSAAGPNGASVKMPTDIFAGMKLITETSTYLINKYGDNYDFAPALGQRLGTSDDIQLFTSARYKSGDIKTAYIYVPSWFDNKAPEISINSKTPSCLTKNEISASVKGNLPLLNYWHDWKLVLKEHGSNQVLGQYANVDFKPDAGLFVLSALNDQFDLSFNDQILDASLSGKFGFSDVNINAFAVILPTSNSLAPQVSGLANLIAGEQVKLAIKNQSSNACVEQLNLQVSGTPLPNTASTALELSVDLSKTEPGPATLEILQYGAPKQELPVTILKRRAHLQKITHHDLENLLAVTGDNLDRIDSLLLNGKQTCHEDEVTGTIQGSKNFFCPNELVQNAALPDRVTIKYKEAEPAAFDFPITKIAARPHMVASGNGAVVINLSATALQWNLSPLDQFISEDSGVSMLLHAFGGYKLSRGTYQLQLKFSDDPLTEATPLLIPLMSDLTHNELRTKKPLTFEAASFPSVVNPIWYRVVHQPSGLSGDWQMLNRSAIYLPQLTALSHAGDTTLIHGAQLELIDSAGADLPEPPAHADAYPKIKLAQCERELCLELNEVVTTNRLKVKLHWIDNRIFEVSFPQTQEPVAEAAGSPR